MEARLIRTAALAALLVVAMGARFQTANFIVETADPQMAKQLGQTAEKFRRELAIEWLGRAMPNWSQPCVMTVQVGPTLGAGGATTFIFDRGEVYGWRMTIQGSAERLLDSVLPHEITHMIFASHFRRPLPRWADEGGATSVEHASEKTKHRAMLNQFLRTGKGIAFSQMFAITEYPRDPMPLYAQSFSLAEYLIQQGGRRKYVAFLADGLREEEWPAALQRHYGFGDLGTLQNTWVAWVAKGSPVLKPAATAIAASAAATPRAVTPAAAAVPIPVTSIAARRPRPEPNLVYHTRNKEHAVAPGKPAGSEAMSAPAQVPLATVSDAALPLPTDGWRPKGVPVPPPPPPAPPGVLSPDAATTQVTRPPAMEVPGQMEWGSY
jgi:hypothetical protein